MGIDHLVAIKAIFLKQGVIWKHPEKFTPMISTSKLNEMYVLISWLQIISHQNSYLVFIFGTFRF